MHLASNQRPCSFKQTVRPLSLFTVYPSLFFSFFFCSYVQELEARLIHMESIFKQLAPVIEQLPNVNGANGASGIIPPVLPTAAGLSTSDKAASESPLPRPEAVEDQNGDSPSSSSSIEDDFSESFGQLALDEYGHLRWIGGSSIMSLIQSFKALTSSPLRRISPMEEDPHAPGPNANKLYFPAAVFFGRVHALPGPEEVEYPERDLADKLVRLSFSISAFFPHLSTGRSLLRQISLPHACD